MMMSLASSSKIIFEAIGRMEDGKHGTGSQGSTFVTTDMDMIYLSGNNPIISFQFQLIGKKKGKI